jgi:hypothetical protein
MAAKSPHVDLFGLPPPASSRELILSGILAVVLFIAQSGCSFELPVIECENKVGVVDRLQQRPGSHSQVGVCRASPSGVLENPPHV